MNKRIIVLFACIIFGVVRAADLQEFYTLVRAATNDGQTNLAPSALTRPYGTGTAGSQKILKAAQELLKQLEEQEKTKQAELAKCKTDLETAKRSGATSTDLDKCKKDFEQAQKRVKELEDKLATILPDKIMETVSGRQQEAKDQPLARIEKLKKERDDAQGALKSIVEQLQKTFGAIEAAILAK